MTDDLDPAAVHLWFAPEPEEPDDQELAAAYREVMSEEERRRERDFAFDKDRRLYRLARVLVRTALSRHTTVDPRAWVFETTAQGRPYVASPAGSALRFSVSHTPGMAMVLVATGRDVGVDVENAARFDATAPPTGVLGPSELADYEATPHERRARRFLEYWTLKESYAKARGTGLSFPLSGCQFLLGVDGITATADTALTVDPEPGRWWFALVSPTPDFVAAVTASRGAYGEPPRLDVHAIDPLRA